MSLLVGSIILYSFFFLISKIQRSLFAPSNLFLLVWASYLLLHWVTGFYNILPFTVLIIVHLSCYFSFGAFLGSFYNFKSANQVWSEIKLVKIIYLFFILLILNFLFFIAPNVYIFFREYESNFGHFLRRHWLDYTYVPIYLKFGVNFSIILIILLFVDKKINIILKLIMIIISLLNVLSTFSKGYFLIAIFYIISVKYFKMKLASHNLQRSKEILYLSTCFICVLIVFYLILNVRENIDPFLYVKIYFFSPLPAFQLIANNEFNFPFPTLFGFLKPFFANLGLTVSDVIDDNYVYVPEPTNVFTIFGPCFSNYGLAFSVFYFFIIGFFSGLIYRLALAKHMVFIIFYGYIIYAIFASVFSDAFANIQTIANYLVVLFIINQYLCEGNCKFFGINLKWIYGYNRLR